MCWLCASCCSVDVLAVQVVGQFYIYIYTFARKNENKKNTSVIKQNTTLSSPDIPECGSLVGKAEKLCKASEQSH